MSKYGQPMSQTLAHMHLNELKMNDPKLNKIFDKLKKGDTVKLKTSSTMSRGSDFVDYVVKSKNVVNKGRVEKITLATVGNEKAVKKFLYKRDGKVTFAIGDMGASIDDIKEKYSIINHEIIEEIELDELKEPFVVVDTADGNKVVGTASDEKGAKSIITSAELPPIKIKDKKTLKVMKSKKKQMIGQPFNEEEEIDEGAAADARRNMSKDRDLVRRGKDSADVDDTASDADKKSAMKNMIMQMRQSLDSKGSKPIEFEDGKKQKVDPKILTLLTKAHDQIQKPRDKEQFVKMISKSYRDMLKVSKMVGKQLRMGEEIVLDEKNKLKPNAKFDFQLFDDEDSPGSDKANADMNKEIHKAVRMKDKETARKHMMKVQNKHSKHGATDTEPREVINQILDAIFEMKEKFQSRRPSSKEVKMAIGIANDPRYKQGNMSGAVKAIEKIRDGLSDYPEVAAALKKANENLEEGKMKDLLIKTQDLMGPSKNREQGIEFVMKGLKISKKEATKLVDAVLKMSENLDEAKYQVNYSKNNKLYSKTINAKDEDDAEEKAIKKFKIDDDDIRSVVKESLEEKYDLYHKSFSDAMQHAYDYAKKKLGITVDPKEIDSKVATGPKKPSEGKTNKYRLKGKGGNLQIQVYNKGGSKPFELNMYKEENEMTKSLKDTIVEMWSEAVSPAQQAAIAISKKEKEQDEGNAFTKALKDARENGDKTFVVSGKTYNCEDYDENGEMKEFVQADGTKKRVKEGDNRLKANKTETNKNDKSDDGDGLDAVQPKAVKKKFKDRKDKDIDNDGDVDDSDKFLHKRRKAVSKAITGQKESIERYHETKKGSLRDAVLQMWGEKHTPDHKEEKNEKKTLTKEKKNGTKNMTDTGKEVTPVETSVKMPKIKETNNKV